jgi:protein ImuB
MASLTETIHSLPLAALRLPDRTVDILQRLGLQQIGELLELPRVELESRFGPQLLHRLDQAFGNVTELIQAIQPPLEFIAEWLFEYPVPQRKAVERVVRQLVERLCFALADHDRGVLRLRGRIVCQDALPVTWEVGLFRPSANAEHVWRLVETQLERLPLPGPATSVALQANHHARLLARQQELFDQHQRNVDSPQIATLVDCLASQLGREAVVRCVLQRDAQPERAFRDVPLVGDGTKHRKTGNHKSRKPTATRQPTFGLLDRPLQLVDPPHVLEVIAVAPDGPPISFYYLGSKHDVTRHWGPERIETGWWRQRGIRRDYYRVETAEGRRYWVFRCLHDARWRLHGVY